MLYVRLFVFTTVKLGRRLRMLVCLRTPAAWAVYSVEFLCRRKQRVLHLTKAACSSRHTSILQLNAQFKRTNNPFTVSVTGPCLTSRHVSVFDGKVSRKGSMSSTGRTDAVMSQRMVWVDLEASYRAKTGL